MKPNYNYSRSYKARDVESRLNSPLGLSNYHHKPYYYSKSKTINYKGNYYNKSYSYKATIVEKVNTKLLAENFLNKFEKEFEAKKFTHNTTSETSPADTVRSAELLSVNAGQNYQLGEEGDLAKAAQVICKSSKESNGATENKNAEILKIFGVEIICDDLILDEAECAGRFLDLNASDCE
ncbi:MAG: hypothetical protein K0Q51_1184 [Rickettsiaceae bacterium]|jgi:hypothetical protein|nr:hypothetical protein [Rickettsiaceae bacterium]